jgi:hypothetical protein
MSIEYLTFFQTTVIDCSAIVCDYILEANVTLFGKQWHFYRIFLPARVGRGKNWGIWSDPMFRKLAIPPMYH